MTLSGPNARAQSDVAGNIGVVSLHLSKPPGREVVVTLGSKVSFGLGRGDDKSFSVAEGGRFTFNDQNWNQPALAFIQLHQKLKTAAMTTLEIRSGNIPLSWSITSCVSRPDCLCSSASIIKSSCPIRQQTNRVMRIRRSRLLREFVRTFGAFFDKG